MLNFLRRFTYQFKEYILFILLVVISLSLLSSNDRPEVKNVRKFALGNFAFVNSMLSYISDIFRTNPSYSQLKEENAKLMLEINRLRKAEIENKSLRTMLSLPDTMKYPLVAADIVSKLVNKIQGNFIINRGLNDSIHVGMPVISSKGLVGIIADVTENFSVVKTLYNSSLNIAVTVQNINVDGVLTWNGHELMIKNIPTTYEINVGDKVETSDFSSLFPPNIPIGVISKKESLAIGLLHTVFIEPYSDIRSANNLFVVKVVPSKQINKLEMNLMK